MPDIPPPSRAATLGRLTNNIIPRNILLSRVQYIYMYIYIAYSVLTQ